MKNRILALLFVLLASWQYSTGQTTNYQAYSVFVYGMSKYMSWPSGKTEFLIAVLGKSKAYEEMTKALTGKSINGLPIKVIQVDDIAAAHEPHILYVSDGKSSMLEEAQKTTSGKPVLIIGEREGTFKKGAGISFVAIDSKLRIDMNNTELQARHIKASNQIQALVNESF